MGLFDNVIKKKEEEKLLKDNNVSDNQKSNINNNEISEHEYNLQKMELSLIYKNVMFDIYNKLILYYK